jgi:glucan-binding YG repeat protein
MGIFSITEPNCLNIINTKAYAQANPSLRRLYLSEGDDLQFSEDIKSYIVDVNEDIEYIVVKAKPKDANDRVEINGELVTNDKNYRQVVDLEKGKNTIKIEIEDNITKNKSVYYVYVYRGGKDTVYLNDIYINETTIGFSKSDRDYNIELDEDTDIVDFNAITGEGNYSIMVNSVVLSETNSIKLKFKGIGKYTISIVLKDEDTQRVGNYTLNIYLGIAVSPNVADSINSALKPNQWVMKNGRWKYNDILGNPIKDTWFYDNKYKSYFYFNSRGNMETEWIVDNGKSYYLNLYGEMQTGWILYEEEWYFLGSDGAMRTGWIKYNGKWYFLDEDGIMENGWIFTNNKWYYLNSSGIMETGWKYYEGEWYYLNFDGDMQTGWIKYGEDWYFMNSNGDMKSGEWLYDSNKWYYLNYAGNMRYNNVNIKNSGWLYKDGKYYYFNEDGTMRTSTKTIDGYIYEFNKDGSVSNV